MKRLACIVLPVFMAFAAIGQVSDSSKYDSLWKEVEEADSKNLPKTALKKVEDIYNLASEEKNDFQLVRSIANKIKYLVAGSENGFEEAMTFVDNELKIREGATKHICNFLLATIYKGYYESNRYQIESRTAITDSAEYKGKDFRYYDKAQFYKIILGNYNLALNDDLRKLAVDEHTVNNFYKIDSCQAQFFPTVYDVLCYAIISEIREMQSWGRSHFDRKYFCDVEDFVAMDLDLDYDDLNSAVMYFMRKSILGSDKNSLAYSYNDFRRIDFLSSHSDGDELGLFLSAQKKYENTETEIFINERIAGKLAQKSAADKISAVRLMESTLSRFPNSKFRSLASNKLKELTRPDFSISCHEFAYPNANFPIYVEYENCSQLEIKVIKGLNSAADGSKLDYSQKEKIREKTPIFAETITLPDFKDYSQHTTAYIAPKLEPGYYLLTAKLVGMGDEYFLAKELEIAVSKFALVGMAGNQYLIIDQK
ncbi:MAG: hypothetical protein HUK15_06595, partial [Bacteroidales bacterium]|nr:hypothetical protein [Bacteroidales bacterium]